MNDLRVCTRCHEAKPAADFCKGRRGGQCKPCWAAYNRERRIARGEEFLAKHRERITQWRRAHGIKPRVLLTPEQRREKNRVTNRWCTNEPLKVDVLAKGPRVGPDIYVGQCLLVDVVAEEKFGVLPDGLILFPEDYYRAGKDLAEFAKGYRGVIHCEYVG